MKNAKLLGIQCSNMGLSLLNHLSGHCPLLALERNKGSDTQTIPQPRPPPSSIACLATILYSTSSLYIQSLPLASAKSLPPSRPPFLALWNLSDSTIGSLCLAALHRWPTILDDSNSCLRGSTLEYGAEECQTKCQNVQSRDKEWATPA